MKKLKKMLVPIDGSERALGTVRYISKIKPFHRMHVVLYHVFSAVPEAYWDLEREPKSVKTVKYVRAWQVEQRKQIEQYLQQAREILLNSGFAQETVELKIHNRKKGVARDIIREAQDGYDLVLTRRRGMGALAGVIIGSTAIKLLQGLTSMPLLLAGRKPPGDKFLVAFDGSPGARRAVDFVAAFLGDYDYQVGLVHVIRGDGPPETKYKRLFLTEESTTNAKVRIQQALDQAVAKLVGAGFKPEHVSTKTITGVVSRAGAIVDEAKEGQYGTIVLGRRGLSQVQEFFIGRVTNKVLHAAKDRSVWVIR
jgi:nucleotide-binding universal stress UspA family protein